MIDVVCIGQAVLDCITRGKESSPYRPNVYRAESILLHTGGDAVNESMALAGMGFQTAIVCGLGWDIAGNLIENELARAGVNTAGIRRIEGMDTPIANLQVAKDGSRISVNSGATRLPGYRILPEEIPEASIVSFASLFRPPLEDFSALRELIFAAREKGAVICADTKLPLTDTVLLENLKEVLPLIDYIFPNEKEAAYYSQKETFPEMAAEFRRLGIRNVIIKTGAEGCFVSGQEGEFCLPAVPVSDVVDTTGAGDNFVAGFLSGILRSCSLKDCASLGLEQAARSITHTGGGTTL